MKKPKKRNEEIAHLWKEMQSDSVTPKREKHLLVAKEVQDTPPEQAPTPDVELAQLIEKADAWASAHFLLSAYKNHGLEPLDRALKASIKIWKLEENLGITKEELYKIALYIETKLFNKVEKGQLYIKREKGADSRLPRTVEYDPKTDQIFIHLKTHGVPPIGSGWHKKCTRSIVYHTKHPELAANCVCLDDASKEIAFHKLLKGNEGLIHTYAVTEHIKEKTKKKVTSLLLKFYNAGSLRHHQYSKHDLTRKEQVMVARDLLLGLESLHKHDLVHRDLHGNNILVDRKHDSETGQEKVTAAIIDFGQTKKTEETKQFAPEIQIPPRFNPPEAFKKEKARVSPKAADIYALGCNLYHLYYHIIPQWTEKGDFDKIGQMSNREKQKFKKNLKRRMVRYLDRRKERLAEKKQQGIDTPYDLFAKVILKMCHPIAKKRGTARELRQELDSILEKIG